MEWNHKWWSQPHHRAATKTVKAQVEHINGNAASRQKDDISQDYTTTLPGGTTPASAVIIGPA